MSAIPNAGPSSRSNITARKRNVSIPSTAAAKGSTNTRALKPIYVIRIRIYRIIIFILTPRTRRIRSTVVSALSSPTKRKTMQCLMVFQAPATVTDATRWSRTTRWALSSPRWRKETRYWAVPRATVISLRICARSTIPSTRSRIRRATGACGCRGTASRRPRCDKRSWTRIDLSVRERVSLCFCDRDTRMSVNMQFCT